MDGSIPLWRAAAYPCQLFGRGMFLDASLSPLFLLDFFETGPRRGFVGTRRGREGLSRDRNESEIFFAGMEGGERKDRRWNIIR